MSSSPSIARKVATGLATGNVAVPELAAQAVMQAMQAAETNVASSVLLFLTSEFARDPVPALRAAAKAASCIQVMGCSAPGILTEEDWILDAPAAAAMVFSDGINLQTSPATQDTSQLLLTLAAPNAINTTWMTSSGLRYGGVSGDAMGQGPFSVWQNGKGAVTGHCEAIIKGVDAAIAPAHGLRMLGEPRLVTAAYGHDLRILAGKAALVTLRQSCATIKGIQDDNLPLHSLMAVFADNEQLIDEGKYQLAALVSGNESDHSVTLAKKVERGQYLCWAIRDAESAQFNLKQTANQLATQLPAQPEFGLIFSCLGRGPYFYGGVDRDLALLRQLFPGMPFIGFYGNGEIAPVNGANELLQYSAVLGLFSEQAK
ncbi:MAG TPA: FIST C-terminal domain-containing protein [Methylophilaceae bacterium]|nr:FIST C-terminal domain-containing protein [Methylophilaceae bacterium]